MLEKRIILRPEGVSYESYEGFAERSGGRVLQALEVAKEIHLEDFRKTTGEPYINHCIAVVNILEQWGADEDELIAGLLHDTVEDHPDQIDIEDIRELFGERVAFLVSGVTLLKNETGEKNEFETMRKVSKESLIDVGVAKIKLADRKHNMQTMVGMKPETQRRKAKETLTVYAPLAESFGMWQVKNELEDLSFPFYDPDRFRLIKRLVDSDPRLRPEFILGMEEEISRNLKKHGIEAKVSHEVGGYWEISEKQKRLGIRGSVGSSDISEITDVISFRVMIEDEKVEDCYKAMGLMRMNLASRFLKERHDDYLRETAVNGYSALHDTYRLAEGNVEIGYTTYSREDFNNWGVVSLTKEEILERPDLYQRKRVFTPKEKLIFLEPSATGIDIAYKINSSLGLRAVAIKVDGRLVDLGTVVPSDSMVEVIYDDNKKSPDIEWLSCCNEDTKRKIEKQMMVVERDLVVEKGRKFLVDEVLMKRGILELRDLEDSVWKRLLSELGCWYGVSDLYYKVAMGMDVGIIEKKLEEFGIGIGEFTTLQIVGKNGIGIADDVAKILFKNKADSRTVLEKVDENDNFVIRILMRVDYKGKKRIEQEVRRKYGECVVV